MAANELIRLAPKLQACLMQWRLEMFLRRVAPNLSFSFDLVHLVQSVLKRKRVWPKHTYRNSWEAVTTRQSMAFKGGRLAEWHAQMESLALPQIKRWLSSDAHGISPRASLRKLVVP